MKFGARVPYKIRRKDIRRRKGKISCNGLFGVGGNLTSLCTISMHNNLENDRLFNKRGIILKQYSLVLNRRDAYFFFSPPPPPPLDLRLINFQSS